MTGSTILRMKSYIQPFERELAHRELATVLGASAEPIDEDRGLWAASADLGDAGDILAYWECLGGAYTAQVRREALSLFARNGVALADLPELSKERIETKIPRSRCLRYGPHGIHEYRGKFFPQLVKSLINISGVRQGTILDPMCGSGTTLVEARSSGNHAIGFDMNPLSVFISQTKCSVMDLRPTSIVWAYDQLKERVANAAVLPEGQTRLAADDAYLRQWFSDAVLSELDVITAAIAGLNDQAVAQLFRVSLSNIIRRVSYQKEEDLRVRREYKRINREEVRTLFLDEALRAAKSVAADVSHGTSIPLGQAQVCEGDARSFVRDGRVAPETVDLVITSPPYATALPYLDTDRLSLSYLELLPRASHRAKDLEMIGNREITEKRRRAQWQQYLDRRQDLPLAVRALIERVEEENSGGTVGFRRRNLGALLATYFFDMRSVLTQIHEALKPRGQAYLVVGNNRTKTPLGSIEICTSELLLTMAESIGFGDCQRNGMEMLHSRDIFRENRTPSEHILSMRRQ